MEKLNNEYDFTYEVKIDPKQIAAILETCNDEIIKTYMENFKVKLVKIAKLFLLFLIISALSIATTVFINNESIRKIAAWIGFFSITGLFFATLSGNIRLKESEIKYMNKALANYPITTEEFDVHDDYGIPFIILDGKIQTLHIFNPSNKIEIHTVFHFKRQYESLSKDGAKVSYICQEVKVYDENPKDTDNL